MRLNSDLEMPLLQPIAATSSLAFRVKLQSRRPPSTQTEDPINPAPGFHQRREDAALAKVRNTESDFAGGCGQQLFNAGIAMSTALILALMTVSSHSRRQPQP